MRATRGLCQWFEIVLKSRQAPEFVQSISGMIGIHAKVGEEKLLPAGAMTAAIRLNRNEHRIDLIQCFWIVELQHPPLLPGAVFVKNPEVEGLRLVGPSPAPGLKRTRVLDSRLLIQIVSVE